MSVGVLAGLGLCGLLVSVVAVWLLLQFQLVLKIPFDGEVAIDTPITLDLVVPLKTVLTKQELDLRQLVIPLDTYVMIDEQILLEATLPVDTQVATPLGINVPIKASVALHTSIPLKQRIRVREDITVALPDLSVAIDTQIPVKVSFQFKQSMHLKTVVDVPLHLGLLWPLRITRRAPA